MAITSPPTIPQITDPTTFATRAQDWVVWQSNQLYPFIIDSSQTLGLATNSTSTTSNTIGLGEKTFTVETGKGYFAGQSLSIANTASPTNRMFAVVVSYSGSTLVVNVQAFEGSGTYTAWSIALAFNGLVSNAQLAFDGGAFGFRNRIINGDMRIDQRNAGASVTPTNGQYLVDRWRASLSVSSKYSVQQNAGSVTPPVGFTNYLGCTSLSTYSVGAGEVFVVSQRIEGFNGADLNWGAANAKTVTISFLVYSSLTGAFGGSLQNNGGTRSYPFSYTISTANTWEQKTITVAGDTSGTWLTTNGVGIVLNFSLGVGSTFSGTAGSWSGSNFVSATGATSIVGTNGATFYITGVQLEKGTTATSFDYRPFGTELALCQRYFETGSARIQTYVPVVANQIGWCSFANNKRVAPTMTQTFSGSGSSSYGITTIDINGFAPFSTSAGTGIANCSGAWTATSEL
jgi:hypothetical protein